MSKSVVYIYSNKATYPDLKSAIIKIILVLLTMVTLILNKHLFIGHNSPIKQNILNKITFTGNINCNYYKDDLIHGLLPVSMSVDHMQTDLTINPAHYKQGVWEINNETANYAIGTSMINLSEGNTGIFGINSPKVFEGLKNLNTGDYLYITAKNNQTNDLFEIKYEVTSKSKVTEEDDDLFYPSDDSILTIVSTGHSFTNKDHVVTANPISIVRSGC